MSETVDVGLMNQLGFERTSTRKASDKLGQEDFLKLMTTQLRNQDPMKPMESGDFLGQIAQFASVTGIQDMQSSVKQLVESLTSNQTMQAASLVGRSVVAPSDSAVFSGQSALQGGVQLDAAAERVTVDIMDQSGQLIRKLNLGPQKEGIVPFAWDGQADDGSAMPAGVYRFKAEALSNGQAAALTTLVAEPVRSVTLGTAGQSPSITLDGGATVKMNDIKQIM